MCLKKRKKSRTDQQDSSAVTEDANYEKLRLSREGRKISGFSTASQVQPTIVVVGAGAAGLACAVNLVESGFTEVIVLEAEDRLGGRICTIPFADNVVDMGAQWVHGEKDNLVFEKVCDMELLESTGDNYVTFECIRSNGVAVPREIAKRLKQVISKIFSERREQSEAFDGSFGDYLAMRFYTIMESSDYHDIDKHVAHEFFENFKKIESSETGGLNEVSAKGFNDYWECAGDYLLNWKDQGFQKFIEVLLQRKELGHEHGLLEGKIVLGAYVDQLRWDRDDAKVEVLCENIGKRYLADHVILTVSLGVLKQRYQTLFLPDIPLDKMKAIQGLSFGCVFKVFLEFPYTFWPKDWTGFTTLWRKEDVVEFRNTPRAWLLDVYGFYCVNYQPRVLQAWMVGPHIEYAEALTKEVLQEDIMLLVNKFLQGWIIPDPVNIASTSWTYNKHFWGAYSYRSLLTDKLITSAKDLAQPLTILAEALFEDDAYSVKPVVLFAGEATSDHYYATVHGAVETGLRESGRLAGYYAVGL